MPIDWDSIRPGLATLFCTLSGLDQVLWADQKRPFLDPKLQAWILLKVRREIGVGVDDARHTYDPAATKGSQIEFQQAGTRQLILEIRVESFLQDDDRFAFNAAGKVRTGLSFPSSLGVLQGLGLAIVQKGPALDVSGAVDDTRITSVAVLELELAAGVCDSDPQKTTWIETVDDPVTNPGTVINRP